MKLTAKEFSKRPEEAYRAADRGEEVTINHGRYKNVIFILTARNRGLKINHKPELTVDPGA